MEPWPALDQYARKIFLPDSHLEIFFFEAGDPKKPEILMIHGLGDEADTWRHIILPLSQDFHVVALDLPGFGRSDKPDVDYTPKFHMDSIMKLVDDLKLKNAILVGHSLGAILSQALTLKHPDQFSCLILVDGGLLQAVPMGNWQLRLMQIPMLGEWTYTRLRKHPAAAYDSLRNVYQNLENLPMEDRDFLYTRVNKRVWSDGQRRAYFSTLRHFIHWSKAIQSDLPESLSRLNTPTLVIRGENDDDLFPEKIAKSITEVQPNAKSKTIGNVKHMPHQENPEAFLSIVFDWLLKIKL